ncbi:MAG TPA: slipin family protein, partial [Thermoanaerobaculia bacterium]|nr:slipin family protein [Thermoanaerobaculia bacterium]
MIHRYNIKPHERGLVFKDGDLVAVLTPGVHWYLDLLWKMRLQVVSPRDPWLVHKDLDIIVKSGKLAGEAIVVDLKDSERALVWIDGRMERVLAPGVYALWTSEHEIRVETIDASGMRLIHPELPAILKTAGTAALLELVNIEPGHAGVWYRDGAYQATLGPGTYAFWKNVGKLKVYDVDLKEQVLDISGQEIMTADKVTLRLNALVAYRITDPLRSVTEVDGASQALYRSAQLALREAVGAKDLDTLLAGKDALAAEVAQALGGRATELGMTVVTAGVRDLILPGDMKDLMNKVT